MSMPRKIRCRVESIADHGGRVYTVVLAPEGAVPSFKAGQFMHLAIDEYDGAGFWPESRVFSIASSPGERGRLSLCYSAKGAFTTKMEKVLRPGATVWAKLPYGEFLIDAGRDAVLIAGGTGISAFTAFIEGLEPGHPCKVLLAYGARSPGLLLSREMAERRAAEVPGFSAVYFVEEGAAGVPGLVPGRISLEALWARVEGMEAPVFYLSGPPVMLGAIKVGLGERGVAAERVRMDAWE